MSEARNLHVNFDTPPRANASGVDAAARIAAVVRNAQADAPDALYNEALLFARANDLAAAAARLELLLVLDPDDAQGRLLLARVLAAQGRGSEAQGHVGIAVTLGVEAPADLRAAVEEAARVERQRSDEARARAGAREAGELRALRAEARTLRSDALRLEAEVSEARRREGRWRWISVGMAAVSMIVLVAVALKVRSTPATVTAPTTEEEARLSLALEHGAGDRTAEIIGSAPSTAERKGAQLPDAAPDASASGGGVAEGGGPPSAPEAASTADAASAPVTVIVPPSEGGASTEGAPEVAKTDAKADAKKKDAVKADAKKDAPEAKSTTTAKTAKSSDAKADVVSDAAKKSTAKSSKGTDGATTTKTAGPRVHVVKSGDTLGSLALKYYGKASLDDRIRKANKALLKSKKGLKVGMKLTIP